MKPLHVMADLETWGLRPGSHLRSIGAVEFDPFTPADLEDPSRCLGRRFYVNIAKEPSYGLIVEPGTDKWWADQSAEAKAAFATKQNDLLIALRKFTEFLHGLDVDPAIIRIWSNGPSFDHSLLEAAFRAVGRPYPWHYRAPRDCRTVFELAGMDGGPDYGTFHTALDDAISQALGVQQAYSIIGARPC